MPRLQENILLLFAVKHPFISAAFDRGILQSYRKTFVIELPVGQSQRSLEEIQSLSLPETFV